MQRMWNVHHVKSRSKNQINSIHQHSRLLWIQRIKTRLTALHWWDVWRQKQAYEVNISLYDDKRCKPHTRTCMFCSSAVPDPRVRHTMDVLSPFISVHCHSDWLFHGGVLSTSWCCPSRSCVVFLACVHLALFLALSLSPGNSLVYDTIRYEMLF